MPRRRHGAKGVRAVTPAARISAVIDLLGQVLDADRPADAVAAPFFRTRRFIGAKDRAAIAERLYAVLRHHARLGWWLDRAGWPTDPRRGRVAAFLRLVEGLTLDALPRLFSGAGYAPPRLDDAELAALGRLPADGPNHPDMPAAVRLECPDWAYADLAEREADLQALLRPAPVDLRVNDWLSGRDAVLARLRAEGIAVEPTPYSPFGLRLADRLPLAGHPLVRGGVVEVQDEGSQIVALMTDARPGMQVVDFCAGAGGKALMLAARMGGKGRVVVCDVSAARLDRARARIRRARLDNIEPRLLSDENDRWVARQKGKFDRVLVDAPCSGSGAWRRNPDARWHAVDLDALTALQDRILRSAARLVKPGGWLVYATCSLLNAENERRIDTFLSNVVGFRPVPAEDQPGGLLSHDLRCSGPWLHLSPAHTFTDGFFIARLERIRDFNDPV